MGGSINPLSLDKEAEGYTPEQLKLCGYLATLNVDESVRYAKEKGIPFELVLPEEFVEPTQVISCLNALFDEGISPTYLFNKREVWGIYLLSVCEERFKTGMELVLNIGTHADMILFLRACYKFGYQAISDAEYDALEALYLQFYPALSYLNETTNDDTQQYTQVVYDAIRVCGLKSSRDGAKVSAEKGSYASLNAEKSTSVRPVRTYKETYEYLLESPRCGTHWSLKIDGFNTKSLFKENEEGLDAALSRGRATDSWDYTEAVQRIIDTQGINASKLCGKVTGETIVASEGLEYLRTKYSDKGYKSPKSTAGAMLRAPHHFDFDDYKYLRFLPFEYGEYRKDEAFRLLQEAGVTVPPYLEFAEDAIPLGSLEEFSAWLDSNVLDPIWEKGIAAGIGSDGVVLQLLTSVESDRADKYSDLNIALKFSHWAEKAYESRVVRIIFEQKRVEMSVVLEVEPVTTRDLNVATRVSVGSPAILVNHNVRVGDKISFTRKSEAINVYEGKVL